MPDIAGYGAAQHANDGVRHTLSLKEVEGQLTAAGLPRSHRHVVRLCKSGAFDASKRPGASGDEWFVAAESVPKVIGDLRAIEEARARRSTPGPATSDNVLPTKLLQPEIDTAGHGAPQRAASDQQNRDVPSETQFATSRYVAQLEKRIEEKDQVIGILRGELVQRNDEIVRRNERERETNILIRGLQNLVLRLQPGSQPSADVLDGDPLAANREVDAPSAP